jgi:rhamnulokinase
VTAYVAVDLGATSGRVVVGRLRDGRFDLTEVHRFANEPRGTERARVWDVEALFGGTVTGLRRAAEACSVEEIGGVGVTAWGVDVGLLDAQDRLLAPVQHYRAADPDGGRPLLDRLGAQELYTRTGVLPQSINTAFRIREIVDRAGPAAAQDGVTALLIPDLWCALMTGDRGAERSIASTTSLVSLRTGSWDTGLLDEVGVDRSLLPPVVENRQVAGGLRPVLAARIGVGECWPFVRVASHDTASAVAAVSGPPRTAFLSSGTWSLLGIERQAPILSGEALAAGFTNEAGLGTSTLFMRNLTGLWLLEQAVRQWRAQGLAVTVPGLVEEATAVGPTMAAFDVTAPELVTTDDVLGAVRKLCAVAGMAAPSTPGEVARCILQSLALTYRRTIELCEELTGEPVDAVRMIGGGSQNALLRRLTADACARPLRFGPVEGTSLGSVATQALTVGELSDEEQAHEVLAGSATVGALDPSTADADRRYWPDLDRIVPRPWSGT